MSVKRAVGGGKVVSLSMGGREEGDRRHQTVVDFTRLLPLLFHSIKIIVYSCFNCVNFYFIGLILLTQNVMYVIELYFIDSLR